MPLDTTGGQLGFLEQLGPQQTESQSPAYRLASANSIRPLWWRPRWTCHSFPGCIAFLHQQGSLRRPHVVLCCGEGLTRANSPLRQVGWLGPGAKNSVMECVGSSLQRSSLRLSHSGPCTHSIHVCLTLMARPSLLGLSKLFLKGPAHRVSALQAPWSPSQLFSPVLLPLCREG